MSSLLLASSSTVILSTELAFSVVVGPATCKATNRIASSTTVALVSSWHTLAYSYILKLIQIDEGGPLETTNSGIVILNYNVQMSSNVLK